MKFKAALIFSVILHISLFALVLYVPQPDFGNEMTYYVDLISLSDGFPGDGLPGGREGTNITLDSTKQDATIVESESGMIKDLTVEKDPESELRYPDKNIQKKKPIKKKKEQKLITVVKKPRKTFDKSFNKNMSVVKSKSGVVKTGISSSGTGNGIGSGFGTGRKGFGHSFPYGYYVETLRNKISSSWYSSLISPGLKGKFLSTVYFKVYRNGSIKDLKLERQSGNKSLDLSALRAVENASPFPPLPSDFSSQYLIVHFEFEWER